MQVDTEGKASLQPCSLPQLLVYFAKLGAFGFGGPIALTGAMQRDLVERERWISLQEYKEGLALSQLAPGPLAAQLAILSGLDKVRCAGGYTRRLRLHPAVPLDGARALGAVPP